MSTQTDPVLADLTTLRVGGPVARVIRAASEAELVAAVRAADEAGRPVLVLGGGSNVLAGDERFAGDVVLDGRHEITVESQDSCGGAVVTVSAGTPWGDVVEAAVTNGWSGIEALAGIPGSTGATPVQNVGAYGQEVAEVLFSVRTWDRAENRFRTFVRSELGLGYRSSMLKSSLADGWGPTPRWVVLEVTFQFVLATRSAPVRYAELARTLGVAEGERADAAAVRDAVLALRAGKGMVLDPADHDTWSAGSFFTNPILPADRVPDGAPAFPAGAGLVKTSAAWLISHAGVPKGYPLADRPDAVAALSTKHVLALTNRGGAHARDVLALAREVRDRVRDAYGIDLVPEPVFVGLSLD